MRKWRGQSGYTLVEAIIYISILAVISVIVVYALLAMVRAYFEFRLTRNLATASLTVMERLSLEARQAYDVDLGSTLGVHPGNLILKSLDASENIVTTTLSAVDGDLVIDNGEGQVSLLPPHMNVTNLVFRRMITANSQAVKVELSLRDVRKESKEVNLMNTIILRGSYEQ